MEEVKSTVDLEKLRDERCIPIAREILNELPQTLLPEDANVKVDYNPICLSILKKLFDADTNIAMDNTYLFQIILQVLGGLNKAIQSCETVLIDDVRYASIGNKILSAVANGNVRMGNVTPDQVDEDFVQIKARLNEIIKEEKLSMLEVKYIMDNIFESFSQVTSIVNKSVEQSAARAEAKAFGVESMSDLTMKMLDEMLKK